MGESNIRHMDIRPLVCPFVCHTQATPPLDSEMGWTSDLWLNCIVPKKPQLKAKALCRS